MYKIINFSLLIFLLIGCNVREKNGNSENITQRAFSEAEIDSICAANTNSDMAKYSDAIRTLRIFNGILQHLSDGGTGFGHEYQRIPSYVNHYQSIYNADSTATIDDIIQATWQIIGLYYKEDDVIESKAEKLHKTWQDVEEIKCLCNDSFCRFCLQCYQAEVMK